ncbi:TRAP transporter substrate-binding protein [Shouchella clausii]|uniref:TRAP transporter substrate-binding protein n=1 Tax=Shouchella clausii TaxID=79880 RepID=UPI0039832843
MKKATILGIVVVPLFVLSGCNKTAEPVGAIEMPSNEAHIIRVSFNQPKSNPQYIALEQMGKRLQERTNGTYELSIYPNELLGAQRESLEMVQIGAIDMAVVVGSLMENFNDDFAVFNLPYVFQSKEHQMDVINDKTIVGDLYTSLEEDGLSVLGAFHGGVRNVYNKHRPVEEPSDLTGLKIRIIESDTNIQMMSHMGGTGTPMGQGEVYTAIQSGVLDGAENNELIYANLSHVEIAPYYSYTQHLMVPDYIVAHAGLLENMTSEHREIFLEEMKHAIDTQVALFDKELEQAISTAKEAGAIFNDVDVATFQEAVQPVIDRHLASPEAKALYQTVQKAANKEGSF